jgi:hypothetical protein
MKGSDFVDIIDDINIEPNKTKPVLKWVVRISIALILAAFGYGQVRNSQSNRLNDIEKKIDVTNKSVNDLKVDMNDRFDYFDYKLDKVYDDGIDAFTDYQEYSRKQFELIIDYNESNKDLLKKTIELNSMENSKTIEIQLEQAKQKNSKNVSIGVRQVKEKNNDNN